MRTWMIAAIVGSGVLAGCNSGSLGGPDASAGGTGTGGTGTGGTGAIVNLPPTCPATCDTPAGTVHTFNSDEEATTALTGVWRICAGSGNTFPTAPADVIGIEYGAAAWHATAYGSA